MKLLYLANIRLPTEKAHGIQIMNMMRAFSQSGCVESVLIVPRRLNPIKKDPFLYYDLDKTFTIIRLPTLDLMPVPFFRSLWFSIESATFSIVAAVYSIFEKEAVFYTRDFLTAFLFSLFRKRIFYEIHTMPERVRFFHVFVWKRSPGLVAISSGIKKELMRFGVSEKKILVAPDAADVSRFNSAASKEEARRKLDLPREKKIVLYAGHLYAWKGVDTLIDAAKQLDEDTVVYFVGGTEEDVSKHKTQNIKYKNIIFVGHKPHQEIPLWLRAADILVLPTSGKEKIGREYTSPMKLFEYMASGTPIIAADVPSTREVVSEKEVLFFIPDDHRDLVSVIRYGISSYDRLIKQAQSALIKATAYTWRKRAEEILTFIYMYET